MITFRATDATQKQSSRTRQEGPSINDIHKNSFFLSSLPLICLHTELTHTLKFTQHPLFHDPPPPSSADVIYGRPHQRVSKARTHKRFQHDYHYITELAINNAAAESQANICRCVRCLAASAKKGNYGVSLFESVRLDCSFRGCHLRPRETALFRWRRVKHQSSFREIQCEPDIMT